MGYFLVKADPETDYSISDLERDRETIWDGVHNNAALLHIRAMKPGDKVYVYHSQKQKSIVGLAEVIDKPFKNTADPRTSWAVKLRYLETFKQPLNLATMKSEPELADFSLIRISRLSVMPVSETHRKILNGMIGI